MLKNIKRFFRKEPLYMENSEKSRFFQEQISPPGGLCSFSVPLFVYAERDSEECIIFYVAFFL